MEFILTNYCALFYTIQHENGYKEKQRWVLIVDDKQPSKPWWEKYYGKGVSAAWKSRKNEIENDFRNNYDGLLTYNMIKYNGYCIVNVKKLRYYNQCWSINPAYVPEYWWFVTNKSAIPKPDN